MNSDVILLLGRRDEPTDAVEEYCYYLGEAFANRSVKSEIVRVRWNQRGWRRSIEELRLAAESWRDRWVFLQYTALAWSERGFPGRALKVWRILRQAGSRVGVVFHDVEPFAGTRAVDVLRRRLQLRVMRQLLRMADLAIFTISLDAVSWLRSAASRKNVVFIPVGANLPDTQSNIEPARHSNSIRVAVYGITGGAAGSEECSEIARAVQFAAERGVRLNLHAFGRGAAEREAELRDKLKDASVTLRVDGLLPAGRVMFELRAADVTLFVRGPISSRRGSAIAGIACGKPVIAYRGSETAAPITEAGVVLVERDNPTELGEALLRLATDRKLLDKLCAQSAKAQETYFSWRAIADRHIEAMKLTT